MNDDAHDDTTDPFKAAMKGVKPLSQDTHKRRQKYRTFKKSALQKPIEDPEPDHYVYNFDFIDQSNWVSGDDTLSYKHSSIQRKILDALARGRYPIDAELDLHHFTCGEAMAMVDRFITYCVSEGIRSGIMIHGKGSLSRSDKPMLKNMLAKHLQDCTNVLAYHSARPRDGGTGALYVLLKAAHKVSA